jgi:hypothetical protein
MADHTAYCVLVLWYGPSVHVSMMMMMLLLP